MLLHYTTMDNEKEQVSSISPVKGNSEFAEIKGFLWLATTLNYSISREGSQRRLLHHMFGLLPALLLSITLLTKFTIAVAGCSGSYSAKMWHWLSGLLGVLRATKPKQRLERWNKRNIHKTKRKLTSAMRVGKKREYDKVDGQKMSKVAQVSNEIPC